MMTTDPGTKVAAGGRLQAHDIVVGYGGAPALDGVDVVVPGGELTVIVGPNACGKSTLLRTLARLIRPTAGQVTLDGKALDQTSTKRVAREIAMLPQGPNAPEGTTVLDLVARGRYPHRSAFAGWSQADEDAVDWALDQAGVRPLSTRVLSELSGGQRQRAWIAMVLAQATDLVLLDEPTTYLDLAHQIEVLDVARRLQRAGRTVVVVLHELQLAFRYATHLVVMRDGAIAAQGDPAQIVTAELIEDVFGVPCQLIADPQSGTPIVVPLLAGAR